MKYKLLNEVDVQTEVEVEKVEAKGDLRRRFLDLGIIDGTKIRVLFSSPLGNPTAYLIRGTVIAMRENEARLICVKSIE